jgi:SCP-2 sterol transfer family
VIVPERPDELVAQFLPQYVAQLLSFGQEPRASSGSRSTLVGRGPAPVGVGLRVVGAGEWTLSIVERQLVVAAGVSPDVALQVSLQDRDFEALVLTPLRRAVELAADRPSAASPVSGSPSPATGRPSPGTPGSGPAPSNPASLWSRLGRWDEETVELLRRQSGGILLRVEDGGVSRPIALTPGVEPYSLESAECIIDCSLADLARVQTRRANPLDLFYAGQIRISGDAQIALAMAGLFL